MQETYYAILGVPENASSDEIKRAWIKRQNEYKNDEEYKKKLNAVYNVLCDAEQRKKYDLNRRYGERIAYLEKEVDDAKSEDEAIGALLALRDIYESILRDDPENKDALSELYIISRKFDAKPSSLYYLNRLSDIINKSSDIQDKVGAWCWLAGEYKDLGETEPLLVIYQNIFKADTNASHTFEIIDFARLLCDERNNLKNAVYVLNKSAEHAQNSQFKARYYCECLRIIQSNSKQAFEKSISHLTKQIRDLKCDDYDKNEEIAQVILETLVDDRTDDESYDSLKELYLYYDVSNERMNKFFEEYCKQRDQIRKVKCDGNRGIAVEIEHTGHQSVYNNSKKKKRYIIVPLIVLVIALLFYFSNHSKNTNNNEVESSDYDPYNEPSVTTGFSAADGLSRNPEEVYRTPLYDEYLGTWWDTWSKRCNMSISQAEREGYYNIIIQWSSSASQCTYWDLQGYYSDEGKIEYTGKMVESNTTEEGYTSETLLYENGTGILQLTDDGKIRWTDNVENAGQDCLFEKDNYVAEASIVDSQTPETEETTNSIDNERKPLLQGRYMYSASTKDTASAYVYSPEITGGQYIISVSYIENDTSAIYVLAWDVICTDDIESIYIPSNGEDFTFQVEDSGLLIQSGYDDVPFEGKFIYISNPTYDYIGRAVIDSSSGAANLNASPKANSHVVMPSVQNGKEVYIIQSINTQDGYKWFNVTVDGIEGWITESQLSNVSYY